jgi:hypothetical protein
MVIRLDHPGACKETIKGFHVFFPFLNPGVPNPKPGVFLPASPRFSQGFGHLWRKPWIARGLNPAGVLPGHDSLF